MDILSKLKEEGILADEKDNDVKPRVIHTISDNHVTETCEDQYDTESDCLSLLESYYNKNDTTYEEHHVIRNDTIYVLDVTYL